MALSYLAFVLRRLAAVVVVVVGVAVVNFMTFHVLRPEMFAGQGSTRSQLADFLSDLLLHLDLGRSWSAGRREVTDIVLEGLPADASLLIGGVLIGAAAGLAGGALCAVRPRAPMAILLDRLAAVAVCAPVYWVGLMAIFLFSPDIGTIAIPFVGGQGTYRPLTQDPVRWLQGLLLPWLVLALPIAGMCLRMMRHSMRDALEEDYMRTAYGKGVRPRTAVRRHAVPVGAGPVIALAGVSMATIVTNAILIERTFDIPGVLRLTTEAMGSIEGKGTVDYPLLMGIVISGGLFVALGNLVADGLHAWLDPRVRA
jgi:peptide/nickel transport system permease protein